MSEILVSAASSLTEAFQAIGTAFTRAERNRVVVRFNFASSGTLLQQIRQGAPVDVFASASPQEMDALEKERRLEPGTRADFASNRLVLIVPAKGASIKTWADLATAARRVAVSNPDSVPSGRYARETLTRRGLWSAVRTRAVRGENVRQTLAYVAAGDADAGIVFATDARVEKRVRVVAVAVPGKDHAPIRYPVAVVRGAADAAAAKRFAAFLRGPAARDTLKRFGFALPTNAI